MNRRQAMTSAATATAAALLGSTVQANPNNLPVAQIEDFGATKKILNAAQLLKGATWSKSKDCGLDVAKRSVVIWLNQKDAIIDGDTMIIWGEVKLTELARMDETPDYEFDATENSHCFEVPAEVMFAADPDEEEIEEGKKLIADGRFLNMAKRIESGRLTFEEARRMIEYKEPTSAQRKEVAKRIREVANQPNAAAKILGILPR